MPDKGLWLAVMVLISGCVSQTTYHHQGRMSAPSSGDMEQAAQLRVQLGLRYLKQGHVQAAYFNLQRALSEAPNRPAVYNALAYYYRQVSDDSRAEQMYNKALALDGQHGETLNNMGVFRCEQQRYSVADEYFQRAIAAPHYLAVDDAYRNAGLCAKRAQRWQQAAAYLRNALRFRPHQPLLLLALAEVQWAAGKPDSAQRRLEQYHQYAADNARSALLGYRLAKVLAQPQQIAYYRQLLYLQFPLAAVTIRQHKEIKEESLDD